MGYNGLQTNEIYYNQKNEDMIKIRCQSCGEQYQITEKMLTIIKGQKTECYKCKKELII